MLREINSALRKAVLIFGAVFLFAELTKDKKDTGKGSKHGYQLDEFDDIW
ncbi:MAG: hypothetical protein Q4A40_00640 [Bacillota bacterium]|nr:hypothetical protein [Bacillota bacterium]